MASSPSLAVSTSQPNDRNKSLVVRNDDGLSSTTSVRKQSDPDIGSLIAKREGAEAKSLVAVD